MVFHSTVLTIGALKSQYYPGLKRTKESCLLDVNVTTDLCNAKGFNRNTDYYRRLWNFYSKKSYIFVFTIDSFFLFLFCSFGLHSCPCLCRLCAIVPSAPFFFDVTVATPPVRHIPHPHTPPPAPRIHLFFMSQFV